MPVSLTVTNAVAVIGGKRQKCNIRIVDGLIQGILPASDVYGKSLDVRGRLVVPGLIDLHTHGGGGVDFSSAEPGELRTARDFFAAHGVTGFLPTLAPDREETLLRGAMAIARARSDFGCPQIWGIHLEGPFLNPDFAGCLPKSGLTAPNYALFRRVQNASGGLVRRVTLAPELPGAPELIRRLSDEGVGVSIGHTGADAETVRKAIDAGAVCATHLFNAMPPPDHRRPGPAGAALAEDIFCEMICDGRHLAPEIVRLIFKAKGAQRAVAVTDSIMAAGLSEGLYKTGFGNTVVKGADAKLLEDGTRAGSLLTMENALKNLMAFTGQPLEACLPCVTEAPARLLGVFSRRGSLDVGTYADLVVLSDDLQVLATLSEGILIYQA